MNDDLMRAYLVRHNEQIRRLIPTRQQVRLINFVRYKVLVNSSDVSTKYGLTIQRSTMLLKSAYDKGYLKRRDDGAPSGGQLFTYWCALPKLK